MQNFIFVQFWRLKQVKYFCISNHMLRRAIWDKLSERISESFKIARVKQG